MKASTYKVLKSSFTTHENIYFSYTKLSFQKNTYSLIVPIILIPIFLISSSLNLFNAYRNEDRMEMFFFAFVIATFILLAFISWRQYLLSKKIDGKEFYYNQIKKLKVKKWKRNAKLVFEFEDGTRHKLYVKKDESFLQFIRNINFANVNIA